MSEQFVNLIDQSITQPQPERNRSRFSKYVVYGLAAAALTFMSSGQSSNNTTLELDEAETELIDDVFGPADNMNLSTAQRTVVIAAPNDPTEVPLEKKNDIDSVTVSVSGCTGTEIEINGIEAGLWFSAHCVKYDQSTNSMNTYGLQVFSGPIRGEGPMRVADDLLLYPESDLAVAAYPGFTAQQVADELFKESDDFDWRTLPNGSLIYFTGYPSGLEVVPRNKNRVSFVGSSIGVFTIDVYLDTSTTETRTVEVLGVVMNLTQDGLGCLPGLSGAPGNTEYGNATLGLTGYTTQVAGRETVIDGHTLTVNQAIENQLRVQQNTGVRAMGDLVCYFALPTNVGEPVDVKFVNGR